MAINKARVAAQLDDDGFEQLVLANISPRNRDAHVWAALLTPNSIARTHATLVAAVQRNASAMAARRQDPGSDNPTYRQWRHRAQNFARIAQAALSEINAERRTLEAAADKSSARRYREQLRHLASEIACHQQRSDIAGINPEDHDHQLWNVLDTISIPHGPESTPTTLRDLLDDTERRQETSA
ncbi:hypothetical protein A5658_03410 [Mycobacterium sp. 1245111.1]|uniref:hypothetical protein n=1 Tax=Mycobacterium sp. 1245111.1 TaxID=1834073 RepID=UPI000801B211|nr:hypothetical protein [Mycobacterium sp. 1245111.1]OBK38581.1 hypothetical protein A5658_03410 [Mycobacterium sp. 1245111.1]